MKEYVGRVKNLAFSSTAKDTYILFIGNALSAFLGFLFTILIARVLTIAEFGIYSSAQNVIMIAAAVTDAGLSSGLINFISKLKAEGKINEAKKYIKASLIVKFLLSFFVSLIVLLIAFFTPIKIFASNDPYIAILVSSIIIVGVFWGIFPYALQGYKRFLASTTVDNSLSVGRILFAFLFFVIGVLNIRLALVSFLIGTLIPIALGFIFLGWGFVKGKVDKSIYKNLLRYSSWLGINRIMSSFSGRLDVVFLAAMVGASATGIYSVPSRLNLFLSVLASSFSSVIATRLASFGDKSSEKKYLVKSTLAVIPILVGIVIWIIVARPFIVLLFGEKYIESVGIFKLLLVSMLPFIACVPSVSALIYSMKKTNVIGIYSFIQLTLIVAVDLVFIPKIGIYAPIYSYILTNLILFAISWYLVIHHYWFKK